MVHVPVFCRNWGEISIFHCRQSARNLINWVYFAWYFVNIWNFEKNWWVVIIIGTQMVRMSKSAGYTYIQRFQRPIPPPSCVSFFLSFSFWFSLHLLIFPLFLNFLVIFFSMGKIICHLTTSQLHPILYLRTLDGWCTSYLSSNAPALEMSLVTMPFWVKSNSVL